MAPMSAASAMCSNTKQPFHFIILAFIRCLHASLLLFHPGNVPAGRISVAICWKQIVVPLRATSFLFQLHIRKGSQVERSQIAAITQSPLSITAAFVPFSKHLIPCCFNQVGQGWAAFGCWTVKLPAVLNCCCRSHLPKQTCLNQGWEWRTTAEGADLQPQVSVCSCLNLSRLCFEGGTNRRIQAYSPVSQF